METDQPITRGRARRVMLLVAEAILVLATIGLIIAILLPAWVGPSEQKQRESRSPMRFFR